MATCDDGTILANAIMYLADKLSNQPCCGSGSPGTYGGAGTGGAGGTPEVPAPPVDPEGDPPTGYDTWDEYHTDVCNKSSWLVNLIDGDLGRISTLELVGVTLLGFLPLLATTILDPVPGDELVVLASILGFLIAYGETAFQTVVLAYHNALSDLICALYSSDGPEVGKAAALEAFDASIESETTDPVIRAYGHNLISVLLSWNGLNKVYTLQEGITYEGADCSECVPDDCAEEWSIADDGNQGNLLSDTVVGNARIMDIAAVTGYGYGAYTLAIANYTEWPAPCTSKVAWEVISGTWDIGSSGTEGFKVGPTNEAFEFLNTQDPPFFEQIAQIAFRSDTAFTMRLTITANP